MTNPAFSVTHVRRNVHVVRMDASDSSFEQWFLLRSDAHHDNPDCVRSLEYRHLNQAVERGAGIIDAGDLFCAMQGKFDRRSDKSKLRPEHQCGDYLDALVRTTAEDYAPYANHWIVMGQGNHETSILRHHETNLTERLVERIRDRNPASPLAMGGYGGYVRFQFNRFKHQMSTRLKYFHGSGGASPVTRGVIQTNRRSVMSEADIYLTGHVHHMWQMPVDREYLNDANRVVHRKVTAVSSPGYKDEAQDGYGGFHNEQARGPRRLGAWWLKFFRDGRRVDWTVQEAC